MRSVDTTKIIIATVLRNSTPTIKPDASPEERPGINMSLKECRSLLDNLESFQSVS